MKQTKNILSQKQKSFEIERKKSKRNVNTT